MALALCSFASLRSSALLRYFPLVFSSTRHRTRPQRSYQHRLSSVRSLRHKLISSAHSNSPAALCALFPFRSVRHPVSASVPAQKYNKIVPRDYSISGPRVKGFRRFRVVIYFRPRGSSEVCGESHDKGKLSPRVSSMCRPRPLTFSFFSLNLIFLLTLFYFRRFFTFFRLESFGNICVSFVSRLCHQKLG